MTDQSAERRIDVFFYGLYMDPKMLSEKGVQAVNPRVVSIRGMKLRIGNQATMLRKESSETNGIVYSLTHQDIKTLYKDAGLDNYVPEAFNAEATSGERYTVLSYVLLTPPEEAESNPDYRTKLLECMKDHHVPTGYVD